MGNDVTGLKRAEEALRESDEKFRTLFATMDEGFAVDEIVCDENGQPYDLRYLEVNPAFERHTGLKVADILGHTTLELFPDAADDPVFELRQGGPDRSSPRTSRPSSGRWAAGLR